MRVTELQRLHRGSLADSKGNLAEYDTRQVSSDTLGVDCDRAGQERGDQGLVSRKRLHVFSQDLPREASHHHAGHINMRWHGTVHDSHFCHFCQFFVVSL